MGRIMPGRILLEHWLSDCAGAAEAPRDRWPITAACSCVSVPHELNSPVS